jgi:hypothetical protein
MAKIEPAGLERRADLKLVCSRIHALGVAELTYQPG